MTTSTTISTWPISQRIPNSVKWTFCIIIALLGVGSPYFFAQYGINFGDEPYQIMLAQDYQKAPLSFLSAALSGGWGNLIGWEVFSMRCYAITIQIIGIICACLFMQKHIRNWKITLLTTGFCAYFSNFLFNFSLIGWDATSATMLLLSLIAALSFLEKQSVLKIILLAFTCVLATAARLPNAVSAFFGLILILLYDYNRVSLKKLCRDCLIYIFAYIIILYGLMFICFGSIDNYAMALSENAISSHSIYDIILPWIEYVDKIIPCASLTILMYIAFEWVFFKKKHLLRNIIITLCLCGAISFIALRPLVINTVGIGSFFIYGYFLLLLGIYINNNKLTDRTSGFNNTKSVVNKPWLIALSIFGFSLINGIGSNCPIYKIMFIPLIPIALAYSYKYFSCSLTAFTIYLIFQFSPFVILHKGAQSYHDIGFQKSLFYPHASLLSGLSTNKENAEFLNRLYNSIQQNKASNKFFVANDASRFVGYYLSSESPSYQAHNWNGALLNNKIFIDETLNEIKKSTKPTTVWLWTLAARSTEDATGMERALLTLQPVSIETTPDFTVYHYAAKNHSVE